MSYNLAICPSRISFLLNEICISTSWSIQRADARLSYLEEERNKNKFNKYFFAEKVELYSYHIWVLEEKRNKNIFNIIHFPLGISSNSGK